MKTNGRQDLAGKMKKKWSWFQTIFKSIIHIIKSIPIFVLKQAQVGAERSRHKATNCTWKSSKNNHQAQIITVKMQWKYPNCVFIILHFNIFIHFALVPRVLLGHSSGAPLTVVPSGGGNHHILFIWVKYMNIQIIFSTLFTSSLRSYYSTAVPELRWQQCNQVLGTIVLYLF